MVTISVISSFLSRQLTNKVHGLTLFCLLCTTTAFAEVDAYERFAGRHIISAFGGESDQFRLGKPSKKSITLYGDDNEGYRKLACERTAAFPVYSFRRIDNQLHGGKAGNIRISLCDYDRLDRDVAENMQTTLNRIRKQLPVAEGSSDSALQAELLQLEHSSLEKGVEMFRFPVFFVGHGFVMMPTVIAYPADNDFVFVIQYTLGELCQQAGDIGICSEPAAVMQSLVQSLVSDWQQRATMP